MTISVIHPSRSRPETALQTASKWQHSAYNMPEYIFMLDSDDPTEGQYKDIGTIKIVDKHKSAIEAINHGSAICSGDLIVVISDDFDCPLHWDTLLLEALKDKSDFCVKTKDGFQKTLITLPIMDRAYYNRFGYIYNPIYQHMYADQEMTAVAMMLGKCIEVDLTFDHKHYLNRKREKDALDSRNLLTMSTGKQIYNQRLRENFGIEKPVLAYNQISWK